MWKVFLGYRAYPSRSIPYHRLFGRMVYALSARLSVYQPSRPLRRSERRGVSSSAQRASVFSDLLAGHIDHSNLALHSIGVVSASHPTAIDCHIHHLRPIHACRRLHVPLERTIGLSELSFDRILSMSVRQSAHLLVTHLVPNHLLKHGRRLFVWPRRSAQRRQLSEPDAGMTSSHLFQHAVSWLTETRAFVTLHPVSLQLHSSEHRHDAVVPIALPCYPVASAHLTCPAQPLT